MANKPLLSRRRKFCCCFQSSDSDSDASSIKLQRLESDPSPSIIYPNIFASKNFAADKIYFISSNTHKHLVTFRHIIIPCRNKPASPCENPGSVSNNVWMDRCKLFSRFDQGIMMCESAWQSEIPEKLAKNLVRLISGRINIRTCVIAMGGVGSLAIQLAKFGKVITLEEDEEKAKCIENNLKVYGVEEGVEIVRKSLLEFECTEKVDLAVICMNGNLHKDDKFDISSNIKNWKKLIKAGLRKSDNIVLVFPATLDPYDLVEHLENFDIDPFIEFVLLFSNSHLKFIACLIGKLTKLVMPEIVNSLLSRLGMSSKQREFMHKTIESISLRKTMMILDQVEKNAKSGSVLKKVRSISKSFIEVLSQEEGLSLDGIFILHKGKGGEDIARIMEEMSLFFVEIEDEETLLVVDNQRFEGFDNIMRYLEEIRVRETPNKNSLFLLIGT